MMALMPGCKLCARLPERMRASFPSARDGSGAPHGVVVPTASPPAAAGAQGMHGLLSVKFPDWSKILGRRAEDWSELDDDEDSVDWVPPYELVAERRRVVSLSLNGAVGKTLKVWDAVWKQTTG
ncbi:hypothetical protein SORBI_3001G178900 [Sorghum bicolor]|uniref:Uncharacterized protein n=1 Tax=Sorghum bicolor TaxID=4558 RepID=A0A1B6QJJ5_SORBI|nr:hypothetical protein SORBI_3001G178900 [Sorghum bicolor]